MKEKFLPKLISCECPYDMALSGEEMWITAKFALGNSAKADKDYKFFIEGEIGHQRIPEVTNGYFKNKCDFPVPPHEWEEGGIYTVSLRWKNRTEWCGTFKLYAGVVGADGVNIDIMGEKGAVVKRQRVGEIDTSWGWGKPTLYKTRKPWKSVFYSDKPAINKAETETAEISGQIKVKLDKSTPAILEIKDGANTLKCGTSDFSVGFYVPETKEYLNCYSPKVKCAAKLTSAKKNTALYKIKIGYKKQKLSFGVEYKVTERVINISLKKIKEDGLELCDFKMPQIFAMDKDAYLADFFNSGRLINLEKAMPCVYERFYDIRQSSALFNKKSMLILECENLDSKMITAVRETNGKKTLAFGGVIVVRIPSQNKKIKPIKVEPQSWTLEMPDLKGETPTWQTAGRLWRRGLKKKNFDLYRRCLFYKYLNLAGPDPGDYPISADAPYDLKRLTWSIQIKDVPKMIEQVYNITDGMPQVTYLAGWQNGGFDNNYPNMFEIDPRCGKKDDLKKAMSDGRKFNALVGMHDNYDDMSKTENWDQNIAAVDAEGNDWKGWIWPAGLSYMIGWKKYYESGMMQERIKKTIETYGVKTTYHLDVLSSEPLRYDFDQKCPAGANESHKYKIALIKEFNKYGVDMTSECVIHPYVGHIGFGMWTRRNPGTNLFAGDEYIPLMPFVYHGTVAYSSSPCGFKNTTIAALLEMAQPYWDIETVIEPKHIDDIFLTNIPVGLFYDNYIEDIKINLTGECFADYGNGCTVKADFKDKSYEVKYKGEIIAKNFTTLAPGFKQNVYLAYSQDGGEMVYDLPKVMQGKTVLGYQMSLNGTGAQTEVKIENGQIKINMPKQVPVKLMF